VIGLVLGLLLLQTVPQGSGVVTGVVRNSAGSPAARVRVWAVTYREGVEAANTPPAAESLTETDNSGRYRLEIPPGRYYIGSGSVVSPTYFPGTTTLSAARVLTVAANGTLSDIDFGSFVPANRSPGGTARPAGSGVLSGTLRYSDGTPATGISVAAIPTSMVGPTGTPTVSQPIITSIPPPPPPPPPPGAAAQFALLQSYYSLVRSVPTLSDSSGAYQIPNLGADTYSIVAGYADAPVFYPGSPDVAGARSVTLATATSVVDKLDFTVVRPPPGVTVSGEVVIASGVAVSGASARMRPRDGLAVAATFGLPNRNAPRITNVGNDGTFTFDDVPPGAYIVEVTLPGVPNRQENVTVTAQQVNRIRMVFPVTMFTGRIRMEDGSPVPDPQIFKDAIVTTVRNPNMLASTIFSASTGTFSRLMEADEFRFYLRVLPEEYEIKSMRFGSADLIKETLKITGNEPVNVEIRVAKRTTPPAPSEVRVSGTAIDGITGMPAAAERILLCCRESGPAERFSAPIKPDGSFEFAGIPPGRYEAILQQRPGTAAVYTVNLFMDVGIQGANGVTLLTTPRFGQLVATLVADGALSLPVDFRPSVVFVGPNGRVRVTAERNMTGLYIASVPQGAPYEVVVENLPQGYSVKSVLGSLEPLPAATTNAPTGLNPVVILIQRTP
jgi:hypothetical protein